MASWCARPHNGPRDERPLLEYAFVDERRAQSDVRLRRSVKVAAAAPPQVLIFGHPFETRGCGAIVIGVINLDTREASFE